MSKRLCRGWFRFTETVVLALVGCCVLSHTATAAGLPPSFDERDRVVLAGNVHPLARPDLEVRRSDAELPMQRMILALARRPGAQAELDRLVAAQHDPASPLYHRWLTPEQFGARFGLADAQLKLVAAWLESQGFTVDETAKGRGWINFSGRAWQVEAAFATEIHDYSVHGKIRHANAVDPSIPRALAGLVDGVVTLNSFPRQPNHHGFHPVTPEELNPDFNSGTSHYLAPADFATIYDLNSVYGAGINGTGQTVAIVGRTDIKLADVQYFRSFFGLPANDPVFVHNGTDPGDVGGGDETEADLDVEWSGAVARNATIKFVVSKSTTTTDGVDLSAQYIVNNNLAAAMSTSFGQCESRMGATELTFYNNLWSQAVTQGITPFVSAGDSGAAGCNVGGDTTGSGGVAVSGLCTTPFNVCVGGTQFNDVASPSTYWGSTNNATTQGSALSYIPEVAWNESASVAGGANLWSTGGGSSTTYAKPSWQVAPGVPADGKRDIPDVSLSAAGHGAYLIVQGHTATVTGLGAVSGTSASSPSFAGLMALIVQKTGARQGNANTVLYPLAASQYGSGGTAIFHDVVSGNNTVPGVTGFSCTTAYDKVTGLGSVDGAALINNWGGGAPPPPPPTQLLGNPGFENGSASPAPWVPTAGVIDNSTGEAAHGGAWKAWLNGYGTAHTDSLYQQVTIPSTVTTATLTFWLHIDTAETSTTAFDTLKVQVRNSANTVLATLATYSNLNKNTGFAQQTLSLTAYKGQTIRVYLLGTEDASLQTSFVVDDLALNTN